MIDSLVAVEAQEPITVETVFDAVGREPLQAAQPRHVVPVIWPKC